MNSHVTPEQHHRLTKLVMSNELTLEQKVENGKTSKDDENNNEGEVLQTWLARTGECVVRTHMHVDADAAFSAALILEVKPEAQLELTPAAETTDDPSLLAVDMLNGRQAIKGLEQGSAFGLLHKELGTKNKAIRKLFWGWAKQLNLTDSGKRCNDGVVLSQLVNSWRQVGLSDEEIVFRARELIHGAIAAEAQHKSLRRASKEIKIEGGVAVIIDQETTRGIIFRRGAKAIIIQNENGQCILLNRSAQRDGHHLIELEQHLPEDWFIHPNGFIAAYGTPKSPMDPSESGISVEELNQVVQTWIGGWSE